MRRFAAGEPVRRDDCVRGLDVSSHQNKIDWKQAKSLGYEFVFVKATQATRAKDVDFRNFVDSARKQGVLVGAYHYAVPDRDHGDAVLEAQNFAKEIVKEKFELPPVLDIEEIGLKGQKLLDWIRDFTREIEASTGQFCMTYTSPAFHSMVAVARWSDGMSDRPLWVAHWDQAPSDPNVWALGSTHGMKAPSLPSGYKSWDFWQFDAAKVPFADTLVDRNFFNGTIDDLHKFCDYFQHPLYATSENPCPWSPTISWRDVLDRLWKAP